MWSHIFWKLPCCKFWPWFPHNFSSLFLKLFSNFQNLLLRYFRDNLPLLYFFTFILLLKFPVMKVGVSCVKQPLVNSLQYGIATTGYQFIWNFNEYAWPEFDFSASFSIQWVRKSNFWKYFWFLCHWGKYSKTVNFYILNFFVLMLQ